MEEKKYHTQIEDAHIQDMQFRLLQGTALEFSRGTELIGWKRITKEDLFDWFT